jgi:hypothetical protein
MATVPLMFAQEDVEFGGKPGIIKVFYKVLKLINPV